MRILLVTQDTENARELHSKLLSYQGISWDLRHARHFEEATLASLKESYDVILLNCEFAPNDAELVDGIQNLRSASDASPIVAILDTASTEAEQTCLRLGIDDVLRKKSLNANYLMRRLRLSMARAERQQEERRHAVRKLVYQRSATVLTNNPSQTKHEFLLETERMQKETPPQNSLYVAILKERASNIGLDSITSDLHLAATVETFRSLAEYHDSLTHNPNRFDACVVEQDFYEREGTYEFDRELLGFPAPPMILIANDRSDVAAVGHVLQGFDDCIPAHITSPESLVRYAQLSLARWEYTRNSVRAKVAQSPNVSERRISPRTGDDRRLSTRYLVTLPMIAIPIGPEGAPDVTNIKDAISLDFSMNGVAFQVSNHGDIPARNWLIGVEHDPKDSKGSRFFYSHMTLRSVSYPQGGVRMGTQFNRPGQDMLDPEFLLPKFDPQNGQFLHSLSDEVLKQWSELGVLQPKLLHRIRVCPECSGTATLGSGCSHCGSPSIRYQEQMKHIACGHVSDLDHCKGNYGFACLHCSAESLQIGSDVEIQRIGYSCGDCGQQGTEAAEIGTCLHCRTSFAGPLAEEREVFGYDVERLDILSIVNSTY